MQVPGTASTWVWVWLTTKNQVVQRRSIHYTEKPVQPHPASVPSHQVNVSICLRGHRVRTRAPRPQARMRLRLVSRPPRIMVRRETCRHPLITPFLLCTVRPRPPPAVERTLVPSAIPFLRYVLGPTRKVRYPFRSGISWIPTMTTMTTTTTMNKAHQRTNLKDQDSTQSLRKRE